MDAQDGEMMSKPSSVLTVHFRQRGLKKNIITAVEPIFFSPIKEKLTGFGEVIALEVMDHLFMAYGEIDDIDL